MIFSRLASGNMRERRVGGRADVASRLPELLKAISHKGESGVTVFGGAWERHAKNVQTATERKNGDRLSPPQFFPNGKTGRA